MTYLDRLAEWLTAHEAELSALGSVTYHPSAPDVPNPSAHLVLARADIDVELLLWRSGEGEFNCGSAADPIFEHFEVESLEGLDEVLERVLQVARTEPR